MVPVLVLRVWTLHGSLCLPKSPERLSCSTVPDFHAGMMKLMECWIVLADLHCLVVRRFWRAFLCGFLVQPTKPIVRGIQEIKHEPNLSLDKQQSLSCGDLGHGGWGKPFLRVYSLHQSRISHVFATDPCGQLRSGHLTCRDLVHQNMPSPVHSSCTLVTQQILPASFLPMFKSKASIFKSKKNTSVTRSNLTVSQLWPRYVESSIRVTKPFPSTSTWSSTKLSRSFAQVYVTCKFESPPKRSKHRPGAPRQKGPSCLSKRHQS